MRLDEGVCDQTSEVFEMGFWRARLLVLVNSLACENNHRRPRKSEARYVDALIEEAGRIG